jgi:GTPase SAR1 family protein
MHITEQANNEIVLKGTSIANDGIIEGCTSSIPNYWGFQSLLVGGPGSGKTSLILNLLKNKKCYKHKFDRIYLISGSKATLPEDFISRLDQSRVFDDLTELQSIIDDVKEANSEGEKSLLIFDDVVKELNAAENKPALTQLAFNRRHIGASLMFVSQKLSMLPTFIRTSSDSIYYYNLSNKKENESLYENFISDLDKDEFKEIIKHIQSYKNRHDFLYLNKVRGEYYRNLNKLILKD